MMASMDQSWIMYEKLEYFGITGKFEYLQGSTEDTIIFHTFKYITLLTLHLLQ